MRKGDQRRAAGDGCRLVERGIGQRQAVAAGLIAVGVIGEGRVDDAAGDRCDRMRERLAGLRIGVIADIRFDQDVADIVIRRSFWRYRRRPAPSLSCEGREQTHGIHFLYYYSKESPFARFRLSPMDQKVISTTFS